MEQSAALDVREARRNGGDEPIAEPELLAQRDALALLEDQRIGAAVDRETVDLLAEDDAAGARSFFEDQKGHVAARQLIRGCEPRDSAADDHRVEPHRSISY